MIEFDFQAKMPLVVTISAHTISIVCIIHISSQQANGAIALPQLLV